MEVFSFLFSGLKTVPEENIAQNKKQHSSFEFPEPKSLPSNPLSLSVPQNMLKILDSIQSGPKVSNDQDDELLNIMKNLVNPQPKQVSNIILSSNIPPEEKGKESPNPEPEKPANNKFMNEFLFLSKVASMCNQINSDDKQKKEKSERPEEEEKDFDEIKVKSKKIKKLNWGCGHFEREHYAKNLCNNCYRKYGRNKKPWNCPHSKLYAHGLCQNCYINKYNQIKKFKNNIMVNPQILSKMNFEGINLEDMNFEHH